MSPALIIAFGAVWAVLIVIALSLAHIAARADEIIARYEQAEALKDRVAAVSLDADAWALERAAARAAAWEREVWVPRVVETTAHVYQLDRYRDGGSAA